MDKTPAEIAAEGRAAVAARQAEHDAAVAAQRSDIDAAMSVQGYTKVRIDEAWRMVKEMDATYWAWRSNAEGAGFERHDGVTALSRPSWSKFVSVFVGGDRVSLAKGDDPIYVRPRHAAA